MLKTAGIQHWLSPNAGANNITGFSGLPGGYRFGGLQIQKFERVGEIGAWWIRWIDFNTQDAYIRILNYNSDILVQDYVPKNGAFSVRCIKD